MPNLIPTYYAPAVTSNGSTAVTVVPEWGLTALFDHTSDKFLISDSGDLVLGNEATTLSQWVINALTTPRLRHKIHGLFFGSDFDLIYGKQYPDSILTHIAEGFIKGALVDQRIAAIKNIAIDIQGKMLGARVTITNIQGFDQQFQVRWSV